MELNNIELNVLIVALDHMEEHLNAIGYGYMSDKVQALESLKTKINEIYVNRN